MLFDGYEDPIMTMSTLFPAVIGETNPFNRVGWLYMRNNSAFLNGWYNVDTGETDIRNIGTIRNWDFTNTTPAFDGECSKFSGSSGEFFTSNDGKTINLFIPDLCRSIPLDFEKNVQIRGIMGVMYSGSLRTYDAGQHYEENLCYSREPPIPAGVFNISSCRFGLPAFISFPHFYNADPYYTDMVDGDNLG